MSGPNYSTSFVLMWQLADFEARQLEAAEIEPSHILLGLFKSVDVDLTTVVPGGGSLADRDESLENMLREVRRLRRIFDNCALDARKFRKCYRGQLGESVPVSLAKGMLHRSKDSHTIFRGAEQLAADRRVFPVHLFGSVLKVHDSLRDDVLGEQGVQLKTLAQASELEMLAAQSAGDDPEQPLLN